MVVTLSGACTFSNHQREIIPGGIFFGAAMEKSRRVVHNGCGQPCGYTVERARKSGSRMKFLRAD
jgi:hypothetical protein